MERVPVPLVGAKLPNASGLAARAFPTTADPLEVMRATHLVQVGVKGPDEAAEAPLDLVLVVGVHGGELGLTYGRGVPAPSSSKGLGQIPSAWRGRFSEERVC